MNGTDASMPPMDLPLLEVKNLTVAYHGGGNALERPVVSDVSLSVPAGSTVAITGESGAGKSSLALAIAGLHDQRTARVSGQAVFSGSDLLSLNERDLCSIRGKDIGFIFQDPAGSLDPSMPVVKQVAEALLAHEELSKQEARKRAARLLLDVGIEEDLLDVAPFAHQLSGGLCQRVMIAAAMAMSPKLLIADEPTSSLDPTVQAQIIGLIRERQAAEGMAIIFISHDLALVSTIADQLLVMESGMVVERGPAPQVIASPSHEYTRELISAWEMTSEEGVSPVGPA